MLEHLKVGYIGGGFNAHFHARALEQVRGMEIAGVFSPNSGPKFSKFVQEHGLGPCKVYSTVRELAQNVDTILITCANFARLEIMEEIAAAKKAGARVWSVMCEKPLGRNVAEAQRLVQLAEECNLRTAYLENQIHMKAIQIQKAQLEPTERSMGPLMLTRSAEEHAGPHEGWFWDPTRQGGGVLSDMGCHSIAVGWYLLNPSGQPLTFLQPQTVNCELGLLKWGQPVWRERLRKRFGVDYAVTPAEDFATGLVTFKNPETGLLSKAQFTDSWMFEKQGLRLFMDGMGPGYAFEVNTLSSPLNVFIGDEAAAAVKDQELALEKSTSSRGLLTVQPNEADLYGYVDENRDALNAFRKGKDALLPFSYGLEITKLVMAAYLSHESRQTVDLTDPGVQRKLETYIPLIQQGRGKEVL